MDEKTAKSRFEITKESMGEEDFNKYIIYRELVLSRANGRNIHGLRGKLQCVLSTNRNLKYWIEVNDNEQIIELTEFIRRIQREIYQETGVSPEFYQ